MEEASPMNFDTYQLDSTVYDWRLAGGKVEARGERKERAMAYRECPPSDISNH